jgi:hypothetical protein
MQSEVMFGDMCCVDCSEPVKISGVIEFGHGYAPVGVYCETHGPRNQYDMLMWAGDSWYPNFCFWRPDVAI